MTSKSIVCPKKGRQGDIDTKLQNINFKCVTSVCNVKKDAIHIEDERKLDPYPSTERISNKQYWIG